MCAWVSTTCSIERGSTGNGSQLRRRSSFSPLVEPAVDQQTAARHPEEELGARDRSSRMAHMRAHLNPLDRLFEVGWHCPSETPVPIRGSASVSQTHGSNEKSGCSTVAAHLLFR
jgi:hypothetical protein